MLAPHCMRSYRVAIAKRPLILIRNRCCFKQHFVHTALAPALPLGLLLSTIGSNYKAAYSTTTTTSPKFVKIDSDLLIEEENVHGYKAEHYYPVQIGQTFNNCYKTIGKPGYGSASTVWLCRDIRTENEYVALKVYINSSKVHRELPIYKHINEIQLEHGGRDGVRKLLGSFEIEGPHGRHICLVLQPLGPSLDELRRLTPDGRYGVDILRQGIRNILAGLQFLHEAHVIHTDLQPNNMLAGIDDPNVFAKFERYEVEKPAPRKEMDGRTIYLSRPMPLTKGCPALSDLSEARFGDNENTDLIMPDVYRAPEVVLDMPWSYPVDYGLLGWLSIWDLLEGNLLFKAPNPDGKYSEEYQLAKMIAILGPPPLDFLQRSKKSKEFWNQDGTWKGLAPIPDISLETLEPRFDGEEKVQFLTFMRKMLQWDPKNRGDCKGIFYDEWLLADLIASGEVVREE